MQARWLASADSRLLAPASNCAGAYVSRTRERHTGGVINRGAIISAVLALVGVAMIVLSFLNFSAGVDQANAGGAAGNVFQLGILPLFVAGFLLLLASTALLIRRGMVQPRNSGA